MIENQNEVSEEEEAATPVPASRLFSLPPGSVGPPSQPGQGLPLGITPMPGLSQARLPPLPRPQLKPYFAFLFLPSFLSFLSFSLSFSFLTFSLYSSLAFCPSSRFLSLSPQGQPNCCPFGSQGGLGVSQAAWLWW